LGPVVLGVLQGQRLVQLVAIQFFQQLLLLVVDKVEHQVPIQALLNRVMVEVEEVGRDIIIKQPGLVQLIKVTQAVLIMEIVRIMVWVLAVEQVQ